MPPLLAVLLISQNPVYTIRGVVRDTAGSPIEHVEVIALLESRIAHTDEHGEFTLQNVESGEQRLLFRRVGYNRLEMTLVIDAEPATLQVVLTPIAVTLNPLVVSARRTGLFGTVSSIANQPLPDADIDVLGSGKTKTDSSGAFGVSQLRSGSYMVRIRHPGYYAVRRSVTIPASQSQELAVILIPLPTNMSMRKASAASGYAGNVLEWALSESGARQRRCGGGTRSVLVTREELAEEGRVKLMDALLQAPSLARKAYSIEELGRYRVFVDGRETFWPLNRFYAEDIEAIEIYRAAPGTRLAPMPDVPLHSFGNAYPPRRDGWETLGTCPQGTMWIWWR